jgi:hypothetical protein
MTRRKEHFWPYRKSNSDPSVVQPVVTRYTNYAIPASGNYIFTLNYQGYYLRLDIMGNLYEISSVKALCKYRIGDLNTKLGLMETDSENVDWVELWVTQDYAMLLFDPFLNLSTEIQQPIAVWGLGQPLAEALSCCLVLSSSVQFSAVLLRFILWLRKLSGLRNEAGELYSV